MRLSSVKEERSKQLASLPDQPGVYQFLDKNGDIIYIGKAVSLRSRVRSYWNTASWSERPKLAVMMPKVESIETILTNSEKEALLLEANLVRQHMPRYNVALKDDRRYPWLAITYDVAFPRLIMVRDPFSYRKKHPQAKVFGPYVESGRMWETVKVLRKVFPLRQRAKPLFKDRPCMNYHIGLCLAPCRDFVEESEYNHLVRQVELFLAGRQSEVISRLKLDMQQASENLEYEKAARTRDRLKALETVIEQQRVFFDNKNVSHDVIAESHTEKLLVVCMMKVREGKLTSMETIPINLSERVTWQEAFRSFCDQYYADCEGVALPKEILLEHSPEDINALREVVSAKGERSVKVTVPSRGKKLELIDMARKNSGRSLQVETLKKSGAMDSRVEAILTRLKEELAIGRLPKRIECFDISNIQGSDNVASMVVFENGIPKKSDYRTYRVQSVQGQANDFASMKEVVGRRYARLLSSGIAMPELIVIDGGKGQLSAAVAALEELSAAEPPLDLDSFDIIGLAKKREEIYFPGRSTPLLLSRRSEALLLLQHIRNEAHRFAVTFHRKLRAKRSISSGFDRLKGVGKARQRALLDYFGSLDKVKAASLEEICQVNGISKTLAISIYEQLHGVSHLKVAEETIPYNEESSNDST